jgi:hypothetical protein
MLALGERFGLDMVRRSSEGSDCLGRDVISDGSPPAKGTSSSNRVVLLLCTILGEALRDFISVGVP